MNRKPIALAVVLLLAGLAPAMAIIGFCTRMPCCSHAPSHPAAAFSTERTGCCSIITCYDSPSAKLANRTASADMVSPSPSLASVAVPPAPLLRRAVIDPSPPATARQRLAALSILRI